MLNLIDTLKENGINLYETVTEAIRVEFDFTIDGDSFSCMAKQSPTKLWIKVNSPILAEPADIIFVAQYNYELDVEVEVQTNDGGNRTNLKSYEWSQERLLTLNTLDRMLIQARIDFLSDKLATDALVASFEELSDMRSRVRQEEQKLTVAA